MRSCSMALQLLSVSVGSYLSGAVVLAVSSLTRRWDPQGLGWLPKDLNAGRLDLFFLLLGSLMVLNLVRGGGGSWGSRQEVAIPRSHLPASVPGPPHSCSPNPHPQPTLAGLLPLGGSEL